MDPRIGHKSRKEAARPPRGDSAREYLNTVVGDVQDGSWRKDAAVTVKQLLSDHWLPAQRSRGLRPTTIAQYENVVDHWLVPHLGGVKAAALTPKHVDDLNAALAHLSARSRQLTVGTLKGACQWGTSNGLLARNPIAGVKPPTGRPEAGTAVDRG